MKAEGNIGVDEKLIDAAAALNLEDVTRLIKQGANPRYVRHTNINGWYSGDTHTALYVATHANFKGKCSEKNYVDVLQALLTAGSDPNFSAIRGNWNHATSYPLFSNISHNLNNFTNQYQKIRFIQIFVKHGININQPQKHSRSKNWRGYQTHTCFIFQMMDGSGIPSRIGELEKMGQLVDFQGLAKEKEEKLEKEFLEEFPEFKQSAQEAQQQQANEQLDDDGSDTLPKNKSPQISFIESLLNFGASPNSYQSRQFWQNYENENYDDGQYEIFAKFDQSISKTRQTILHRAIMNDLPTLVKLLIEKGADIWAKLKFTTRVPLYPNQWPEQVKERKKKKILQNLQQYQTQKQQLLEQLKTEQSEQQKKQKKGEIKYYAFQIFKINRFAIENELPQPISQVKQLTCLQLTESLKVSQQTIELIKQAMSKQQNSKK